MSHTKTLSDTVANWAFVAACVAVIVTTVCRTVSTPIALKGAPSFMTPGTRLPERVLGRTGKPTVLVVVHSECRFRTASMAFYNRLVSMHAETQSFELVFSSSEPITVLRSYLELHGVVDVRIDAPLIVDGVTGTPSLIVADASGTVARSWRGQLDVRQEQELLDYLRGPR